MSKEMKAIGTVTHMQWKYHGIKADCTSVSYSSFWSQIKMPQVYGRNNKFHSTLTILLEGISEISEISAAIFDLITFVINTHRNRDILVCLMNDACCHFWCHIWEIKYWSTSFKFNIVNHLESHFTPLLDILQYTSLIEIENSSFVVNLRENL